MLHLCVCVYYWQYSYSIWILCARAKGIKKKHCILAALWFSLNGWRECSNVICTANIRPEDYVCNKITFIFRNYYVISRYLDVFFVFSFSLSSFLSFFFFAQEISIETLSVCGGDKVCSSKLAKENSFR